MEASWGKKCPRRTSYQSHLLIEFLSEQATPGHPVTRLYSNPQTHAGLQIFHVPGVQPGAAPPRPHQCS